MRHIAIRNFQSLVKVDLDLAPFTVIVGPSSSGKSAFIRACRAAASNLRGAASITRGAKMCAITVRTGDHQITLERTETGGAYRVVDPTGREETYTKLSGAVPQAVTDALRIAPVASNGTSVNFAGQFDAPFLLRESGATVARVLGELTNVDRILDAVREANRRRNAHAATLKTRETDLARLRERAAAFTGLPARLAILKTAEAHADAAQELTSRIARLDAATQALEVAEAVIARTVAVPDVPADTAVLDAQDRLARLTGLLTACHQAAGNISKWAREVDEWETTQDQLDRELHEALAAAGICPTCQRPIE